ncbi:MAG: hypothetical protein J2P41_10030 [Blastocatellia bacterium]|nr:hypothetical protein [Blastocatellia bacterium]
MQRYLLGDLPEAQAAALELSIFTDDETFEQMSEIENGLVDGYVRDRLAPEDREKFERHYLLSPVHERRVKVARQLINRADASIAEADAVQPRVSFRAKPSGKPGILGSWWGLAVAAASLLLMAGNLWLFLDSSRLRREVSRLMADSETRRTREQALADQIAAVRNQNEELKAALEKSRREHPNSSPGIMRIFPYFLSPMLVRSSGSDPQVLSIPPGTDVVRLLLRAEQGESRTFQVTVSEVDGRRQVWQRSLKPRLEKTDYAIAADIPASKLPAGDYFLRLSAPDSAGRAEEVKRYYFRISKQ